MKTIVETRSFTERLSEFMDDESYRHFQSDLVTKDEKDDLSIEEKKILTVFAKQAKAEAVAATRMGRERNE